MKAYHILALAAFSSGFILPDEQISYLQHAEIENHGTGYKVFDELKESVTSTTETIEQVFDRLSSDAKDTYKHYATSGRQAIDEALAYTEEKVANIEDDLRGAYYKAQSWTESVKEEIDEAAEVSTLGYPHHGHHGHHGPPNMTVYQLISKSKYTTKLAALINEFDDLVEALNGTSANFTVFAPTDRAFSKIPKDHPKPSKEFLKALLTYHVSPEFYPAGRILVTRTVPTLLKSPALGTEPQPQRLATEIGFRGLTVNFFSRIVAVDIFGTNGVVHGLDSILLPPPKAITIIELLPGIYSTLELGLTKTGLLGAINDTSTHSGGTLFAPSNFAFQKLGPSINAFLFSEYGTKYLKALLEYHVVPNITLYSDALYSASGAVSQFFGKMNDDEHHRCPHGNRHEEHRDAPHHEPRERFGPPPPAGIPKGLFHVDLPTLLEGRSLSIDVARYGRLIEIKINAFYRVAIADGVAYDGVVHETREVLIPPKKLADGTLVEYDGSEELTVEFLKERLEPFVNSSPYSEDL